MCVYEDSDLSDLSLQLFGDVCFECNKAIVGDGKRPIIKIWFDI